MHRPIHHQHNIPVLYKLVYMSSREEPELVETYWILISKPSLLTKLRLLLLAITVSLYKSCVKIKQGDKKNHVHVPHVCF